MAQDNEFSPLFGHMQASPPWEKKPETDWETPVLPDKKSTLLEALSAAPDTLVSESVSVPVIPVSEGNSTTIFPASDVISDVHEDITVPTPVIDTISAEDDLDRDIPLRILSIPADWGSEELKTPPETVVHIDTIIPAETPEEPTLNTEKQTISPPDSKLEQYLQADTVYQQMIRVEDTEKIRLKLAIRYTLLMFAIFLVLAWIVSNRVIMFWFSEFVWLARIRDVLFAVMAGLFSLTLWFWSVSWTRNTTLVAIIRSLAIVFFGAVVIALYIPF